ARRRGGRGQDREVEVALAGRQVLEPDAERHDQQEREQDLYAGRDDAQLAEKLAEVAVHPLELRLVAMQRNALDLQHLRHIVCIPARRASYPAIRCSVSSATSAKQPTAAAVSAVNANRMRRPIVVRRIEIHASARACRSAPRPRVSSSGTST